MTTPRYFSSLSEAAESLCIALNNDLRLGTPLGLGKPNQLLNLIYQRAKTDPEIRLQIFTALSLSVPAAGSDLERRFLEPFASRHFGKDYPGLDYVKDQKKNKLPKNIKVSEFYLQSGALLNSPVAQQEYVSLNYTHVAQTLVNDDINVIVQMVAKRTKNNITTYSLSSNTDLTIDVADLCQKNNKKVMLVGVVHPEMPFMENDAEVSADFFDFIVDSPEVRHQLFALPRSPVDDVDHMIGLHASRLIKDDGTLQIGIGSLSDALVHSTLLRHQENSSYQKLIADLPQAPKPNVELFSDSFQVGLYGTSEMVMDGFMHLRKARILKRLVKDLNENAKRYLHGAFFLGSKDLYRWLKELSGEEASGLCMTQVSKVNDLYDENEMAIRRQRKNARFFNTCMQVTLLGGAASETLENGKVVSGVGGQYNFVAMSHELPDSHSALMLRSYRIKDGHKTSNIVWSHGYLTIPRHLRDIVITEYGIANIKGKSDQDVIKALIEIADSDFQEELVREAVANKKLDSGYQIPEHARNNTADKISDFMNKNRHHFPSFPLGSDFTEVEQKLVKVLGFLKENSYNKGLMLQTLLKGFFRDKKSRKDELERMDLYAPASLPELFYQRLILGAF